MGANLGFLERRVKDDLERFKKFIESRSIETGAWRGEVHGEEVRGGGSGSSRGSTSTGSGSARSGSAAGIEGSNRGTNG